MMDNESKKAENDRLKALIKVERDRIADNNARALFFRNHRVNLSRTRNMIAELIERPQRLLEDDKQFDEFASGVSLLALHSKMLSARDHAFVDRMQYDIMQPSTMTEKKKYELLRIAKRILKRTEA